MERCVCRHLRTLHVKGLGRCAAWIGGNVIWCPCERYQPAGQEQEARDE